MIDLLSAEIAEITGGRLTSSASADTSVLGVDTDSRACETGWLFVAKPGESSDGHHFIDAALKQGAVLALAERETLAQDGTVHPAIIVPDAVIAMGQIAAAIVERLKASNGLRVVGITGSAGKTTTKDLLAALLGELGPTIAPLGSYNGEVGVPLTVFRATAETKYLVVEMGATGIGHITYLTDMVHPEVGVVLGVGSAHAGEFGGIENIAKAKGEMVEALPATGLAVLNNDDNLVAAMHTRTVAPVLRFGVQRTAGDAAGVWARDLDVDANGHPVFTLVAADATEHPVTSGLIGRHHVANILAAAAVAEYLGLAPAKIAATLQDLGPASRWRMERFERADGVSIINDAYNANPDSMRAALRTLAELGLPDAQGNARRTWAVLGEMLELGEESRHEHDMLGRIAVRMNIKKLLVVGRGAKLAYNSAVLEGSWGDEAYYAEDAKAAARILNENLLPGDIVLFKSSNGAGLRHLGDQIAGTNNGAPAAKEGTAL
ncbi:UDP-N-acetylmuramoyl-tripeptide--D-alanyl-D-alanine ligase [Arthrobacter sp. UCD-GKA]|uniref:UDP-N-acetylmuramoyl-tripeptide--D-alanyl-D- alanine ligase n=1 Tax=Arthrobacter sp. UCD-GKA TaxID=1913576 RepID=UPI0008DCE644|nr:UDP-N-acetylmuramoyl-tripeptide--D-alanyl-D-alanine ligase [Arthrobacter sp. UCD-GKA]OIH86081.1 UDP-N-acetylmuramoyl-tripeptide--D-alanyl-D-alanine ligase [Arthrobacter sp. UCD-GKA]